MSAVKARGFERYPVRRPIYAFLSGDMENVGLLKDISMGGLSVEYLVLRGGPEHPQRGQSGTVIIATGPGEKQPIELPYRFVHSQNIPRASSPWGALHYYVERCGVVFEQLTEGQHEELRKLVSTFH